MERTVANLNIEYFRQKLETEKDETKRRTLVQLLSEEQAKIGCTYRKIRGQDRRSTTRVWSRHFPSVLSSLPTRLARPGPRFVPAPKGFARGWLFPGASRTSFCSKNFRRLPMNASLFYAGRATHLKIVAVSLVCVIVVVLVGHNAKTSDTTAQDLSAVVKAGQPAKYAGQERQTSISVK